VCLFTFCVRVPQISTAYFVSTWSEVSVTQVSTVYYVWTWSAVSVPQTSTVHYTLTCSAVYKCPLSFPLCIMYERDLQWLSLKSPHWCVRAVLTSVCDVGGTTTWRALSLVVCFLIKVYRAKPWSSIFYILYAIISEAESCILSSWIIYLEFFQSCCLSVRSSLQLSELCVLQIRRSRRLVTSSCSASS